MSGGANKRFRKGMRGEWQICGNGDPDAYLRRNIFATNPHNSLNNQPSGIKRMNIREGGNWLTLERIQPGCCNIGPNNFDAYFCGNVRGANATILLGNDCDYFFTPTLSQCILEINGLQVTHHDAEAATFPAPHLAALPVGGGAAVGHRKWESGAFIYSTVVGRRTGRSQWQFWHQSSNLVVVTPLPAIQVGVV